MQSGDVGSGLASLSETKQCILQIGQAGLLIRLRAAYGYPDQHFFVRCALSVISDGGCEDDAIPSISVVRECRRIDIWIAPEGAFVAAVLPKPLVRAGAQPLVLGTHAEWASVSKRKR